MKSTNAQGYPTCHQKNQKQQQRTATSSLRTLLQPCYLLPQCNARNAPLNPKSKLKSKSKSVQRKVYNNTQKQDNVIAQPPLPYIVHRFCNVLPNLTPGVSTVRITRSANHTTTTVSVQNASMTPASYPTKLWFPVIFQYISTSQIPSIWLIGPCTIYSGKLIFPR